MANTIEAREAGPVERPEVKARPAPLPRVEPGPELEALKAFHYDCTWEGRILAGWGGPDTPEIKAVGKGTFKWMMNGLWLAGEFEQEHFIDGYLVGDWLCHYVVGWDPHAQEYKATSVDSNGTASLLHGTIDSAAHRFVLETLGDPPIRVRLTWDMDNPRGPLWMNEVSQNGGPWRLVEDYVAVPLEEAIHSPQEATWR